MKRASPDRSNSPGPNDNDVQAPNQNEQTQNSQYLIPQIGAAPTVEQKNSDFTNPMPTLVQGLNNIPQVPHAPILATISSPQQDPFSSLWQNAHQGDHEAQCQLGIQYLNGTGALLQDFKQAYWWFHLSSDQGNSQAKYYLGRMYEGGRGVTLNYDKAMKYYKKAAAQGHADAQIVAGFHYREGDVVAQDMAQAIYYYQLAAAQGTLRALYSLAIMYDNGEGDIAQDMAQAVHYYQLAAAQGHVGAHFNLAVLYVEGRGVVQDFSKALQHYCLFKYKEGLLDLSDSSDYHERNLFKDEVFQHLPKILEEYYKNEVPVSEVRLRAEQDKSIHHIVEIIKLNSPLQKLKINTTELSVDKIQEIIHALNQALNHHNTNLIELEYSFCFDYKPTSELNQSLQETERLLTRNKRLYEDRYDKDKAFVQDTKYPTKHSAEKIDTIPMDVTREALNQFIIELSKSNDPSNNHQENREHRYAELYYSLTHAAKN